MPSSRISSIPFAGASVRPAIAAWCMALLSSAAIAAEEIGPSILVVTDRNHTVQVAPNTHDVRVIELDLPARIEAQLTTYLPNNPEQAGAQLRQRLHAGGDSLQQRLREAYQGVVDAWQLGITRIPAVVVDRRYVVYGEPDVARALERITAHRSSQR